jgi:hypothetical protein
MALQMESCKSLVDAAPTQLAVSPTINLGDHPPRPPLAFRVGVVGHRPDRLKSANLDDLRATLKTILSVIQQQVAEFGTGNSALFGALPPAIRAISPLAEGTDRIFAEEALALGFELCCVMPFSQAEFEKDFAPGKSLEPPGSLQRFQKLVDQAATKFELDGLRVREGLAYGIAGRTVLNQTDVLLAVWDGETTDKRGGTEETMRDAAKMGIPVVWIDAHTPHPWQVAYPDNFPNLNTSTRSTPANDGDPTESLSKCVREALKLPEPDSPASDHSAVAEASTTNIENLTTFYEERCPEHSLACGWRMFRDCLGDRKLPKIKLTVDSIEKDLEYDWPAHSVSQVTPLMQQMAPYYGWTNKLALVYSDRYRTQFVLAYLLAAFAVGMALFPIGFPQVRIAETVFIVAELLAIFAILALVYVGRHYHWHERWINYRLAAEMLRHTSHVTPFGGRRPFPQIPAHLASYGTPSSTWMAWYVRAVKRYVGLPSVVVDKRYLDACLAQLLAFVQDQIRFHQTTARRSEQIEGGIHIIEIGLLSVTLLSCGLHLLLGWNGHEEHHSVSLALTFICGFFPALGAAMAGILNQGEFRRLEKRSQSMESQLELVVKNINNLRKQIESTPSSSEEQFSVRASRLAADAAKLMLNEVLDWRVVFLDRPFEQPPS